MEEIEEVYRKYFSHVYRYMLRLSGQEQIAEDITAETFLRAMKGIRHFRGECDVRVWLCQIAKNLYFTSIRQKDRIAATDHQFLQNLSGASPDPEYAAIQYENVSKIKKILQTTEEPYRGVFYERVFEELSFAQIGQRYGKTANWACVTYHRARAKIRMRLEAEQYEK